MTTYNYADGYLGPLVSNEREERALAEVEAIRDDFPTDWLERLTVLRAYILTCLDSMRSPDDLFSAKLTAYRKEWDAALAQARQAADLAAETDTGSAGQASFFSFPIERG